ncbi:hypothetical protein ACG3SL_12950 [Sphingomonas sp. CJ20]
MAGHLVTALAIAAAPAGGAQEAVLKAAVQVRAAELRVGDLVKVRGGGLPVRIASLVVARLPRGATALDLPAATLATLVRRRVPGLRIAAPAGTVRIRATLAKPAAPDGRGCFAAAFAVPASRAVAAGDVVATECRDVAPARLRYAQGGLAVARAALPAGSYLGRLAALPGRAIAPGAALTLRSQAGPVTIERAVTAMQPGLSGKRLFVRDAEGKVFAVPLALAPEGEVR